MVVCEPAAEIAKHTHLIATLASGRELRFIDPRMFGKLSVHAGGFDPGGVEPLEVSEEQFRRAVSRAQDSDQERAPESEAAARRGQHLCRRIVISGRHSSAAASGDDHARRSCGKLYRAVQEVLREAIALGGSSISDYVDADGEEGFFQLQHRVYGREGEPCLVCGTADPARCAGGPQQSLLSKVSKIAVV